MGIFKKSARNVFGVNSHFPYIFICLTTSFNFMREESLINGETYEDLFDAWLSFWENAFTRGEITQYEYANYFLMTLVPLSSSNLKSLRPIRRGKCPYWPYKS
jgi:hypothetical protein